jgi:ribosomal protein S27E
MTEELKRCTRRCVRVTAAGVCTWCATRTAADLDDMTGTFLELWCARVPGPGSGPKVSRSKTPAAPVRAEVVDHADQIVAVLGSWAALVAETRRLTAPTYTLTASVAVLRTHHDWATAQAWAPDYCEEVRTLAHTARVLAQLYEPRPELIAGVQCRSPKCDLVGTLFRAPGSQYIECGVCGNLLTEPEYREWTAMLAAAAKSQGKAAS